MHAFKVLSVMNLLPRLALVSAYGLMAAAKVKTQSGKEVKVKHEAIKTHIIVTRRVPADDPVLPDEMVDELTVTTWFPVLLDESAP